MIQFFDAQENRIRRDKKILRAAGVVLTIGEATVAGVSAAIGSSALDTTLTVAGGIGTLISAASTYVLHRNLGAIRRV